MRVAREAVKTSPLATATKPANRRPNAPLQRRINASPRVRHVAACIASNRSAQLTKNPLPRPIQRKRNPISAEEQKGVGPYTLLAMEQDKYNVKDKVIDEADRADYRMTFNQGSVTAHKQAPAAMGKATLDSKQPSVEDMEAVLARIASGKASLESDDENDATELIYVIGSDLNVYADIATIATFANVNPNPTHHSSFFDGAPVLGAGHIVVRNNRVEKVTNKSGHYIPGPFILKQTLEILRDRYQVDLTGVEVEIVGVTTKFKDAVEFLERYKPTNTGASLDERAATDIIALNQLGDKPKPSGSKK